MPLDYAGKILRGWPFKPGEDLRGANFRGANLQGVNFKGQDLTGANFSHADIQGANFSNAILIGANFTKAKAGIQPWWRNMFLLSCLGIMGLALTLVVSQALAMFVAALLINGIAPAIAVAMMGAVVMAVIGAVFIGVVATVNLALSVLLAVTTFVIVAIVVAAVGSESNAFTITIIANITFVLLSSYISWRALAGDRKFPFVFVRSLAISIAAENGTTFREADLTNANFTQAKLKHTDLTNANLTGIRFYQAKQLELAKVNDTILTNSSIRDLLVNLNGQHKSYIGANLRGAKLIGADLRYANFKEADITDATFQRANLEWANLTRTQAIGTDFTNAQMTGACVENWNINNNTKLDNIDCRFVYLLENAKPGTDDRERCPSSGDFAPGEFTKLFEEVLNTVDLIFRNGVDWKAFISAFKKVQVENEGTELAIQSIENKGDGVVVVRVSVSPDANKEKIHSDFTQNYELALAEVEKRYKTELQAKDREIEIYRQQGADLKEIVTLLANRPVNVINKATAESKAMNDSTDQSRNQNLNIGSVGRDFNASGQALNVGNIDISGVVTNTINELPASPVPDKPGLKELLTQLQAAIEAETNLSKEDRAEALEQVKALAEAGKNPKEGATQKVAKTASTMLKGIFSGLPAAAALVEAWNKLWPAIARLFGLA